MATPGIDIRRGRIVHFASRVRSICESVLEETPIFISRLVEDSGERITGRLAAAGSREASTASRSCTTCRAAIRSVPSLRIRTTDERPSTDFDRIVLSPIVPFRAFSSGTLIRLSTSSVESPGASVWISIRGGANSGKTSSGACRARWMPTIISTIDSASTMIRSRSDVETIQFIMGRFAPVFSVQFSVFSARYPCLLTAGCSSREPWSLGDTSMDPLLFTEH